MQQGKKDSKPRSFLVQELYNQCKSLTLLICMCNVCSVSSLMTTTEAIVVELPKDDKDLPMGGGMGGMGGMDY